MDERDATNSQVAWVGMLVFALGFAGLGVWGLFTGAVAWGVGSILFGVVWGFAALRARRSANPKGGHPHRRLGQRLQHVGALA